MSLHFRSEFFACLLAFAFVIGGARGEAQVPPPTSAAGTKELLVDRLKGEGFSCQPLADHVTNLCTMNRVDAPNFKYAQPFGIVVPQGLVQPQNLILHFHGFQNICQSSTIRTPQGIIESFGLLNAMKAAGAMKDVLLVPLSNGAEADFNKSFVPQTDGFLKWAEGGLNAPNARWILSGHSGAGMVINRALSLSERLRAHTKSVVLLDATYGSQTGIAQAARQNPALKVFSAYRPGSPTQARSLDLAGQLGASRVRLQRASESHCTVPNAQFGPLLREARSNGEVGAPPSEAPLEPSRVTR